jgi:glutamate--cysteine ligase
MPKESRMPTSDKQHAISLDEARHRAGRQAFANAGERDRADRIGLEQEQFAIKLGSGGFPAGRVRLHGKDGAIATLDDLTAGVNSPWFRQVSASGLGEYRLAGGGRITFEPGAQVEHSSAVHPNLVTALDDLDQVSERMNQAFRSRGAILAAAGIDLWHDIEDAPQQLRAGRYTSMADYFDQRSRWGRVMMRHSASLQINLDHGAEGIWQERWHLANLMAPIVLATFAASPGPQAVSSRALAWQGLDPTRTGFPALLVAGSNDSPLAVWAEAALDADVMMFQLADGSYATGTSGLSFRKWIEQGHSEHGWPTREDLDYHLTTLFFEVRPRGFLELRSCESLPARWRPAPVLLVTSLLYEDQARNQALSLLDSCQSRLPELWEQAARNGVRAPEIGPLADRLWGIALAGAARLPAELTGHQVVVVARQFLERFTFAGRMPADELAELIDDPGRSLAWATGQQQPRVSRRRAPRPAWPAQAQQQCIPSCP